MLRVVYGTHSHTKYCPVRETTVGHIADDTLFMQWILLGAEVYLAQTQVVVGKVFFFQRKAVFYRELRNMIADPSRNSKTIIPMLSASAKLDSGTLN
jgi:hypothetical protein